MKLLLAFLPTIFAGNPHLSCGAYRELYGDAEGFNGLALNYEKQDSTKVCCGANPDDPLIGGTIGMMFHEQKSRNTQYGTRTVSGDWGCQVDVNTSFPDTAAFKWETLDNVLCPGAPFGGGTFGASQYVIEAKSYLPFSKTLPAFRIAMASFRGMPGVERFELKSNEGYVKQWFTSYFGKQWPTGFANFSFTATGPVIHNLVPPGIMPSFDYQPLGMLVAQGFGALVTAAGVTGDQTAMMEDFKAGFAHTDADFSPMMTGGAPIFKDDDAVTMPLDFKLTLSPTVTGQQLTNIVATFFGMDKPYGDDPKPYGLQFYSQLSIS
jgi:hypothetical protein